MNGNSQKDNNFMTMSSALIMSSFVVLIFVVTYVFYLKLSGSTHTPNNYIIGLLVAALAGLAIDPMINIKNKYYRIMFSILMVGCSALLGIVYMFATNMTTTEISIIGVPVAIFAMFYVFQRKFSLTMNP